MPAFTTLQPDFKAPHDATYILESCIKYMYIFQVEAICVGFVSPTFVIPSN